MTGGGGGHSIHVKLFEINGTYSAGEKIEATPVVYEWKYESTQKSFSDAQAYCVKNGGNLASVHNKEENAKVHELSKKANGQMVWIGANDRKKEGKWIWTDGTEWEYDSWDRGQPDNHQGKQDCGGPWRGKDKWDYQNCASKKSFICKREVGIKRTWTKCGKPKPVVVEPTVDPAPVEPYVPFFVDPEPLPVCDKLRMIKPCPADKDAWNYTCDHEYMTSPGGVLKLRMHRFSYMKPCDDKSLRTCDHMKTTEETLVQISDL